jgi:F0F1-type ATP synthase assembly protein I
MAQPRTHQRSGRRDADLGLTLMSELISAVLVYGGIGWVLDTYVLHTAPWAMVTGFLVGFGLGFYLIYARTQGAYEEAAVQLDQRDGSSA